jgi:hypothetical protein
MTKAQSLTWVLLTVIGAGAGIFLGFVLANALK